MYVYIYIYMLTRSYKTDVSVVVHYIIGILLKKIKIKILKWTCRGV